MKYSGLRSGALVLLTILLVLLSFSMNMEQALPVISHDDTAVVVQSLSTSISLISSIEYIQFIKDGSSADSGVTVENHYYYKSPSFLRVETKSKGVLSVDIYSSTGMYEYFPSSRVAYFREKWMDNKPISFQLNDKLDDIMVRGKYEYYKMDKVGETDCRVIRSVDENEGNIYEHKIWLGGINGYTLPFREEYLTDGEVNIIYEYKYVSINRNIPDSLFELKAAGDLKIHNAEGIPKLVSDEKEAEKFVKFDVKIPSYTPESFTLKEIYIIPPAKKPAVLISYSIDKDIIYFRQANTKASELVPSDTDRVIKTGGCKFALSESSGSCISVKWVKNGVEYEINGPYNFKAEIIKMIQSITGIWISIE